MKKIIMFLLTLLGLNVTTACSQGQYENTDVKGFAELIKNPQVVILDARTAEEYQEGHLDGAVMIDVKESDFIEKAQKILPKDKTIAVYCRSGRRSAKAAGMLGELGYKVINLTGGITAWKEAQMPVTTDTHEIDRFTTKSGKEVRFYALLHASIRMVYDGKEFEIDPVRQLGERKTDYAVMPKADYILVTHEHGDHFDKEAIKLLTGEQTSFITNARCAEMIGYGNVMKNGDKKELAKDITLEAVPAYNKTPEHKMFHPKGRDNGYILTVDGLRIYIAGDTEDIQEMNDIKDIDIAFLPCNQPYTMTQEQLVNAAKMVKPKVLFPYHYGKTDLKGIPEQLATEGIEVRIRHYE